MLTINQQQKKLTPAIVKLDSHENMNELYWTDVYKTGHKFMLPIGSLLMYSNLTPRSGRRSNVKNSTGVLSAGPQKTVRKLVYDWKKNFFDRPISEIDQFSADMTKMLNLSTPFDVSHMKELHAIGYLPIRVKAITEGKMIPYGVPMLTIVNTAPVNNYVADWIVNYLETILSSESWMTPTSATLGLAFKKLGKKWINKTNKAGMWLLDYMFHDFSMRGMSGKSAIVNSGLGWAMVSRGSDTLPVIPSARIYYDETPVCINSVIASEHAIMCTLTGFFLLNNEGTWEKIGELEIETFRYLLRKFPTGILSLVSDTWDLWRVIFEYCKALKDEILERDGKLVIRPDSGDPVDIVCGMQMYEADDSGRLMDSYGFSGWKQYDEFHDIKENRKFTSEASYKGVIEGLWDVFGGTFSEEGYKVLHEKIGAIYGDAITYERAEAIFERLEKKNFAATNIILGVGSYSLQHVTRDVHGFAQKATYVELKRVFEVNPNGEEDFEVVGVNIFKDPITDRGDKKSARGLIQVTEVDGTLTMKDEVTWEQEADSELQTILEDGNFYNQTTLSEIRNRINNLL